MSVQRLGGALLAGLVLLAASACAGEESTDASDEAGRAESMAGPDRAVDVQGTDLSQVGKPWSGYESRYAFLRDPRVMADVANIDLVGVGEVVDFRAGPVYFGRSAADPTSQPQVVLEVRMLGVTRESASRRGESAYLMLEGDLALPRYRDAIPSGTTVGVYASKMKFGPDFVTHRGAGRPSGTVLWQPAAQGLIVPGPQGVAYPVINRVHHRKTLADVMPAALSIEEAGRARPLVTTSATSGREWRGSTG